LYVLRKHLKGQKMKNKLIQIAIWNVLGLISTQALATGLVDLPATGFAVGSDTSAYTRCNLGNFENGELPTTTSNNTCAVFPPNLFTAPEAGYTWVTSTTRNIVLNDSAHTNNSNVTVGTMVDRVWRNASTNECIYGAQFTMNDVDYDLNTAGTQYFEINDFVRSGFSGRPVAVGYHHTGTLQQSVLFRAGRTNVSVQYRPDSGYLAQPLTTPTPASAPINGVVGWGTPTAAQQSATLDDNYVDYTVHVSYYDSYVKQHKVSPYLYAKTSCSSSSHTATSAALTFRQTGQEGEPWISFSISGYVPN
jgi:hypothetical protein